VLYLLKNGAETRMGVSIPDNKNTVLHVAMRNKSTVIIEALISSGSDLNAENIDKEKPIDIAKAYQNGPIVSFLETHNANNVRSIDDIYNSISINSPQTSEIASLTNELKKLSMRIEKLEKSNK